MKFKKGDLIIVTASRNGAPVNQILEVVTGGTGNIVAKTENGTSYTVYQGAGGDTIVFADRKTRLKHIEEQREELLSKLKILDRDIDILKNYDSDEAYTAMKISKILQAKDDPKAIEILLRELKESSYL